MKRMRSPRYRLVTRGAGPSARRAARHVVGDRRKGQSEPHAAAHPAEAAAHGADEHARAVDRKGTRVAAELLPQTILPQVLLDIGNVERGDRLAGAPEVARDGAERLRAAEIADDGHQEIARLERLHHGEVGVAAQEAAVLAAVV